MTWMPDFNPLVCPFCEQTCEFPHPHTAGTFEDNTRLASCGCGVRVVIDTAEDMGATSHDLFTHHPNRDARYVRRVDFWGPIAYKGEEPRDAQNEWDGDWVDALFYRLS